MIWGNRSRGGLKMSEIKQRCQESLLRIKQRCQESLLRAFRSNRLFERKQLVKVRPLPIEDS